MAGLALLMSCLSTACCSVVPLTAWGTPCAGAKVGRADETTPTDDTLVVGAVATTGWAKGMAALTGVGGPAFGLIDGVVLRNNFCNDKEIRK